MAFPGTYNFSYYRGDTFEFVISPKSANGTTFSLDSFTGSGAEANFVISDVRGSAGDQTIAQAVVDDVPRLDVSSRCKLITQKVRYIC